jgi:hypothetical protein
MGIPNVKQLNFRKRIITRGGNDIRLYHIYEDYIHGAYESNGQWYIACWQFDGHFLPPDNGRQHIATLDLINEEEEVVNPQSA